MEPLSFLTSQSHENFRSDHPTVTACQASCSPPLPLSWPSWLLNRGGGLREPHNLSVEFQGRGLDGLGLLVAVPLSSWHLQRYPKLEFTANRTWISSHQICELYNLLSSLFCCRGGSGKNRGDVKNQNWNNTLSKIINRKELIKFVIPESILFAQSIAN